MSTRTYVIGDGNVILEVVIGQGHLGAAIVVVNGTEVNSGEQRFETDLGPGTELAGAVVQIFSRIGHTSPQPFATVTYNWSGGPEPQSDEDSDDFATGGNPMKFRAVYLLAREA